MFNKLLGSRTRLSEITSSLIKRWTSKSTTIPFNCVNWKEILRFLDAVISLRSEKRELTFQVVKRLELDLPEQFMPLKIFTYLMILFLLLMLQLEKRSSKMSLWTN